MSSMLKLLGKGVYTPPPGPELVEVVNIKSREIYNTAFLPSAMYRVSALRSDNVAVNLVIGYRNLQRQYINIVFLLNPNDIKAQQDFYHYGGSLRLKNMTTIPIYNLRIERL